MFLDIPQKKALQEALTKNPASTPEFKRLLDLFNTDKIFFSCVRNG